MDRSHRRAEAYDAQAVRRWTSVPSLVLVVAAVAVGVEIWVTAGPALSYARIGYRNVRDPTPKPRDADLDPLSSYISTGTIVLARETIPPDATYTVVVGNTKLDDPGVVGVMLRLWLAPRRYTDRLASAQWVVAYHESSEALGVPYTREVGLGPDANAVELKR
jgi:hypothetical protein